MFVPVLGDFVAIPAAIAAVIAGLIGFNRADQGHATNGRDAVNGGSLGVLALLITLLVFATVYGAEVE
ncbi:hypothetical protein [Mycolicibacterium baixiangningiae]|uniref:hypothetical protein n=1 Tax=Mycolicibacterium baixiangningiae TaxID=2761578 RepID=UPI001D0087F2|nr:hypothetical protein [Mycolicibacterium baixiangningiae]